MTNAANPLETLKAKIDTQVARLARAKTAHYQTRESIKELDLKLTELGVSGPDYESQLNALNAMFEKQGEILEAQVADFNRRLTVAASVIGD